MGVLKFIQCIALIFIARKSAGEQISECYNTSDYGASYRGLVSNTTSGYVCQKWGDQSPHVHTRTPETYPNAGLEENYCRNPDNEDGPWCYTMNPLKRWEYCDVRVCEASSPCDTKPCHPHAVCKSNGDSYQCRCLMVYSGDGITNCQMFKSFSFTTTKEPTPSSRASMTTTRSFLGPLIPITRDVQTTAPIAEETAIQYEEETTEAYRPCRGSPCHSNAICTDLEDTFECNCLPGYEGDGVISCEISTVTDLIALSRVLTTTNTAIALETSTSTTTLPPTPIARGKQTTTPIMEETTIQFDEETTIQYEEETTKAYQPCDGDPCHSNAICTNLEDRFQCNCLPGYEGDGITSCEKTEPSTTTKEPTPPSRASTTTTTTTAAKTTIAISRETITSTTTLPPTPTTRNIQTTTPIAEETMTEPSPCVSNPCHANALCVELENDDGFICICKSGYSGDGVTTCNAQSPCDSNPCHINATCEEKDDSYSCRCVDGYRGDGIELCRPPLPCEDNPCHVKAMCIPRNGIFRCECVYGFHGDGQTCRRSDKCRRQPCHRLATCRDTDEGGFECTCKVGYEGNGFSCTMRDPCMEKPCHAMAECTKQGKSHQCECKAGYKGNGTFCEKRNPCMDDIPCHPIRAVCTNTKDSFKCECLPGYKGDGKTCEGKNPCENSLCDRNAKCVPADDTERGYKCECNEDEGFYGSGFTCKKLCGPLGLCGEHANCKIFIVNQARIFYRCDCQDGFSGDGKICTRSPCYSKSCPPSTTCRNVNSTHFVCECSGRYEGKGPSYHYSSTKYVGSQYKVPRYCNRKNACSRYSCYAHSTCEEKKVIKGYRCYCKNGYYTDDGVRCIKIDPCSNYGCPEHSTCKVTDGGKAIGCLCNTGYQSVDGIICKKIDACTNHKCPEHSTCKVIEGGKGYSCPCNNGYQLEDGITCKRNPCYSKSCPLSTTCRKDGTHFYCECTGEYEGRGASYHYSSTRYLGSQYRVPRYCNRKNYCSGYSCYARSTCEAYYGHEGYKCYCKEGYYTVDGDRCIKRDACAKIECPEHSTCEVTNGGKGYTCRCIEGYHAEDELTCINEDGFGVLREAVHTAGRHIISLACAYTPFC